MVLLLYPRFSKKDFWYVKMPNSLYFKVQFSIPND